MNRLPVVALLLLVVGASACGTRGPLVLPPQPPAAKAAKPASGADDSKVLPKPAPESAPESASRVAPK